VGAPNTSELVPVRSYLANVTICGRGAAAVVSVHVLHGSL
jgi:hypothetical protein